MQCLIDSDILFYEIGFGAQAHWKALHPDSNDPPPFDMVEDMLLNRIAHIERTAGASEKSIFFITGKGNFRNQIAKKRPYKDRPGNKPFHYANIKAYIQGNYEY